VRARSNRGNEPKRSGKPRGFAVASLLAIAIASFGLSGAAGAQGAGTSRLAVFDSLAANLHAFATNPNSKNRGLDGAVGNLLALSRQWNTIRPLLENLDAERRRGEIAATLSFNGLIAGAFGPLAFAPRQISDITLGATRFTGFTQNETANAWCGANAVVTFNDTGSEIRTMLGGSGTSAIGYSRSSNHGITFSYQQTPTPPSNSWQAVMGDPSIVCANLNDFYYSAIWYDSLNNQIGVAVAQSSDGGATFTAPAPAVLKSSLTDIIGQDKLAVDRANSGNLYLVFADIDYSGSVCGRDQYGQPIPRYAIELVASNDGGGAWSNQPVVVDQVCADQNNPYASDVWPQVAVGPGGVVYVAWEAMGVNGLDPTARAIKIARSTDSGATFSVPVTVANVVAIGDGAEIQGFIASNEAPSLAIGQGKKNGGVVYLAWANATYSVKDALTTTGLYGMADVMFAQSSNGGVDWSSPMRVNNNPEGGRFPYTDQFEPAMNTDKTGKIGICFYDRRRDSNNFLIDRYCATSTNGGATFRNFKVTPVNFPSVVGQDIMVAPNYMGAYDTVSVDGTGVAAGLIDSYASNTFGNPNVMANHF